MGKEVKSKAQIELELTVPKGSFSGDVKNLLAQLDKLQDAASIDLQFSNLKGVGDLRKSLNELDKILEQLSSSANQASKQLGVEIENSASRVVNDMSLMSNKTSEFASKLSMIAKTNDIKKTQSDVKKLANAINTELKGTGYQLDVEKLLNLGSVQEQVNMLSEGIRKFADGWSTLGNIQVANGLKEGLGTVETEVGSLNNKLKELQDLRDNFRTAFSAMKNGNIDIVGIKNMENVEEFAANTKKMYQETSAQLKQAVNGSEEYYQLLAKIVVLMNDIQRINFSLEYENFANEDLKKFYEDEIDNVEDEFAKLLESKNIKTKIENSFKTSMEAMSGQIGGVIVPINPQVNINPTSDPDGKEKIKNAVEQSIPKNNDKIEVKVPVEKIQLLDSQIATYNSSSGKTKTNARKDISATLADLKALGLEFDQIKEKMSTEISSRFLSNLRKEFDAIEAQVPTVVSEIDRLNQMLGENFVTNKDYDEIFEKVRSGELNAVQGLDLIKKKEEEIATAAKVREEAQRKANEESNKTRTTTATQPSGKRGSGVGTNDNRGGESNTLPIPSTGANIEIESLDKLKVKIREVMQEIALKTQSFNNERYTVGSVVSSELIQLERLREKVNEIKNEVEAKTAAFEAEQTTVGSVVGVEVEALKPLEEKLKSISETLKTISEIRVDANITENTVASDATASTPDTNDEDKRNQILQNRAKIYKDLNALITESIRLQKIVSSGNRDILPKYRANGNIIASQYYGIGQGYTKDNHVTKTNIKETIKDIQRMSVDNDLGKNDKLIDQAKDKLAAFVATYKNSDEAKDIFGKKEIALWNEIIERIETARVAKKAYEDSERNYQSIRNSARSLGDSETNFTFEDSDKFKSFIKNGDVSGALGFLKEKFKIELEPEIESGAILDEVRENTGSAPVPIEVKPTVDGSPSSGGESSTGISIDSALSSTLSNINNTLGTLNGTLSSFTSQNSSDNTNIDIQGISDIGTNVENIYNILSKNNGEDNTLAQSIKSAVEELSNASKAIAKGTEQKTTSNKNQEVVTKRAQETNTTQTIPFESLNGVIKETKRVYRNYSGKNEVSQELKKNYNELLQFIEKIKVENKNVSESDAKNIEDRCRGIQKEIEALNTKNKLLIEQNALIKAYDTKYNSYKDILKNNDVDVRENAEKMLDEIKSILDKLNQKDNNGDLKLLNAEELENDKKRLKELDAELKKVVNNAQNATTKGSFTTKYDEQLRKLNVTLDKFKAMPKNSNLSSDISNTVQKYQSAITKLKNLKTDLEKAPKGSDTTSLRNQWEDAYKDAKKYEKELINIIQLHDKVTENTQQPQKSIFEIAPGIDVNDINQVDSAMRKYIETNVSAKAKISNVGNANNQLKATFVDANHKIQEAIVSYDALSKSINHTTRPIGEAIDLWSQFTSFIGSKFKGMAGYFASFGSVYQIINQVRQGIGYVREIDLAMTELKKVTNETDKAYERFLGTASGTSKALGSTVSDFVNATADFARLGYSVADATELAKAASIYKNVGD